MSIKMHYYVQLPFKQETSFAICINFYLLYNKVAASKGTAKKLLMLYLWLRL